MRKILQLIKIPLVSIYLVSGIMLAVFMLPQSGFKALSVVTGSMNPAIPQGSLVIIRRVSPHTLKVDDVVTFINPVNTRQTITHRVVETKKIAGLPGFITKGDANQTADKEILGGNVVGKVVWQVPVLGSVVDRVRQPVGLIFLVLLPAALIVWDEIRRLRRALALHSILPTEMSRKNVAIKIQPIINKPDVSSVRQRQRRIDSIGLKGLAVLGTALFMIDSTRASLSSSARLTNNTISTAASDGSTNGSCSSFSNITIADTGPGSVNNVSVTNSCNVTTSNNNVINVSNSTTQSASTRDASTTGNTTSSNPSSGTSANESDTSIEVEVSNY